MQSLSSDASVESNETDATQAAEQVSLISKEVIEPWLLFDFVTFTKVSIASFVVDADFYYSV